jgi:hypothetical protein
MTHDEACAKLEEIVREDFRAAANLQPGYPLQIYSRADETWVIVSPANVWIHYIGSDDDGWEFCDNQNKPVNFPYSKAAEAVMDLLSNLATKEGT